MTIINHEKRQALLDEVQAIPDGTHVSVNVRHPLIDGDGEPFTVTGPIWTSHHSGMRRVGDTIIVFTEGGLTIGTGITSVRRLTAGPSAGLDVQRAAGDLK